MKASLKRFFALLATILAVTVAKSATVFPIATNPAVVNFGGSIGFDGTNYIFGFLAGANVVDQRVSGTNGTLLGSQVVVGSNPGFPPAIAGAFGKTNYLITWSDYSVSGAVDMYGQFVTPTGATFGSKFKLLSSIGSYGFQNVMALAFDGTNYLAVWQDQNSQNIYGQLVTPSGTLSGSEFLISSQSGNGNSAAVCFGKSKYLVVWQSQNGGSSYQTYAELVSRSGGAGGSFQISQTDSSDNNPLTAAYDGTNYLAAWNWDNSGSWDIYGRLVSPTGTFPGNELQMVTDPGSQVLPALAFDGANYLLAWGDGSFSGPGSNVRFQFFNRSGSPSGSEFTVFTAQGTNSPLFTYNGLIFDGSRFVVAATLGTVATDGSGDVTGFPSGEVFGAFIPSSTALQVTTTSLPDGTTTVPYNLTLTASGGQTPYTWTLVSNSLPASMNLSSAGVISGTPTTAVTTNFIVQVKDNTNAIATQALSLRIDPLDTSVVFSVTPATVSNTFSGPITLSVTGLNSNETVIVQKYLDANTNGLIDAGDLLVQQFNLTDGMNFVIGGVTNINVPGDLNPATGAITTALNFQSDFSQTIVGRYMFKLSSPTGHFATKTNLFAVTNFPYAQKFTGTVVSNGVAVSNAVVLLFPAGGDSNPVGGAVANNSGVYTIQAPAGTYGLLPFKAGFVANYKTAPAITLNSSATVATNLSLMATTQTISGQFVDAGNSNLGLPGLLTAVQTQDKSLIGISFTDTNGNFTIGVNANQWGIGPDSAAAAFLGYVEPQNKTTVDTTAGSVTNVTVPLTKATALFYGTVKDNLGHPLPGVVAVYASDNNNGLYQSDGYTDTNGNYVTAAVGGLAGNDPWSLQIDNASSFPNYIFSQPAVNQNGGTNLSTGQAVLASFTAILATNQISGNVKFNGTNIVGVNVYAYATIGVGGVTYYANADTDGNGNYSFTVANGSWNVGVNQTGGNDSLDNLLGSGNYQPPGEQNVNINNNTGSANFTIQPCAGLQILTPSPLPNAQQGNSYYIQLQASSCSDNGLTWSVNDPADFPYGLSMNFDSAGEIFGTPTGYGTFNFSVQVNDGGHTTSTNMSLTISPMASPLQITTTNLPNGTNTYFYSQTLQATGGTPPYSWSIPNYSLNPPANLILATNGVLSGTLADTANTSHSFDVEVTDAAASTYYQTLTIYVLNPPASPLVITNVALPNGNVGVPYSAQMGAAGGQPSYTWQLTGTSLPLPTGLSLDYNSGLISGTPTTNKVSTFKVQVNDSTFTTTNKVFSIIVNPDPILASPSWLTNRFQMLLIGASNQNYTLQLSTNLGSANWASLFITNSATTNSYILSDPNATNKQRFYRVLIGP